MQKATGRARADLCVLNPQDCPQPPLAPLPSSCDARYGSSRSPPPNASLRQHLHQHSACASFLALTGCGRWNAKDAGCVTRGVRHVSDACVGVRPCEDHPCENKRAWACVCVYLLCEGVCFSVCMSLCFNAGICKSVCVCLFVPSCACLVCVTLR